MGEEVLKLREGPAANKAILSMGHVIRTLSAQQHSDYAPYNDSAFTRLLADPLGGNCCTIVVANLR